MTRALLLSMRKLSTLVGYSHLYEFEDVVSEVLNSDVITLDNQPHFDLCRRLYKTVRLSTGSAPMANHLANQLAGDKLTITPGQDYDFLLATFNTPYELFMLRSVSSWREKCKKAACYIIEFWEHDLSECKYLLDFLSDFDHIFLGSRQCVDLVSAYTGKPCDYLPISVDTLRFSPKSILERRPIDVCNLGRRSQETHQSLLDLAQKNDLFYYFDTLSTNGVKKAGQQQTFVVKNPREHRTFLANILKRTNYYIANRARANEFQKTDAKQELSSRFFEGAAAGTIMLGEPPDTEDFYANFDWQGAVIEAPFDHPNIDTLISELNQQPERLKNIRIQNISNSLRRHDSVYRLKEILKALGLPETNGIRHREKKLKAMIRIYDSQLIPMIHDDEHNPVHESLANKGS